MYFNELQYKHSECLPSHLSLWATPGLPACVWSFDSNLGEQPFKCYCISHTFSHLHNRYLECSILRNVWTEIPDQWWDLTCPFIKTYTFRLLFIAPSLFSNYMHFLSWKPCNRLQPWNKRSITTKIKMRVNNKCLHLSNHSRWTLS